MPRDLRGRLSIGLCAALLACAAPAIAQTHPNLDFENGLTGWTAIGDAFGAPVDAATADRTRYPASPLGGDYWKDLAYPLGQHGQSLVTSDRLGRGTLTSDDFEIPSDARYLSILVGGSETNGATRVELHLIEPAGGFRVVWSIPAPGIELLQQRVFALSPETIGRRARLVIVDDTAEAQISVDHVRLTSEPPRVDSSAAWGIADYHAHPMAYLGFGALQGVHTLWGRPGGAVADYMRDPRLIAGDITPCPDDHLGGNTAGIFVNTIEKRLLPRDVKPVGFRQTIAALFKLLLGGFTRHPGRGAPGFQDHPNFLASAHQQMHVTQIHRAWQGGLRLMTAVAIHNEGAEFLVSPVRDWRPSSDRQVLEAQVCGMRRMAALNEDWMAIAYSPADARQIIASGRLAVVLGAEFDRLGETGFASLDEEVQYLWDLGIRQVTPVHGTDNRIGGAAVFEPAYNSLNDLLHRPALNMGPKEADATTPVFFDVREGGCTAGPLTGARGECVLFKLGAEQDRAVVERTIFSWFRRTPTLHGVDVGRYRSYAGHLNARGLTPDGAAYVSALASRGMLVGLEHMSQQTADDVAALLEKRGYPLLVSHAHFRALAIQDRRRTTAEGFLPDEHDTSDGTLEAVRRSGGVTGVFATENPIELHPAVDLPFENDCAGTSKTFALSLLYAMARMGGGGVGLATDFAFIPQTAPRFGDDACWALKDHWDARPGVGPLRDQYHPELQTGGVRYEGQPVPAGVRVGDNAPLTPYRMLERVFDFNVDGLAHYGMLPDLLQDVRNIGVGPEVFARLFSSAEAYIRMWERAEGASGRPSAPAFAPLMLPCEAICRGLCP